MCPPQDCGLRKQGLCLPRVHFQILVQCWGCRKCMIIVGGIMTVPIPSLPLHWHQPLWLVSLQGYWGQRSHRANGEGLQYGGSYPSQMTYHVGGYVPATAAAKSLQSCLPLCGPIDSSPPGSSVHGKSTGVGCHCLLWIMSLLLPILIGLRNYSLGCKNTM